MSIEFTPTNPTSFQILATKGPLVTIHPDGRIELGEGVTVDEAAKAFWDAVEIHRPANWAERQRHED